MQWDAIHARYAIRDSRLPRDSFRASDIPEYCGNIWMRGTLCAKTSIHLFRFALSSGRLDYESRYVKYTERLVTLKFILDGFPRARIYSRFFTSYCKLSVLLALQIVVIKSRIESYESFLDRISSTNRESWLFNYLLKDLYFPILYAFIIKLLIKILFKFLFYR